MSKKNTKKRGGGMGGKRCLAVISLVLFAGAFSANAYTNDLKKVYKSQFDDQVRDTVNDNVDKVAGHFRAVEADRAAVDNQLGLAATNLTAQFVQVSNRVAQVVSTSITNGQALTGGDFVYVVTPTTAGGVTTNSVTPGTAGDKVTIINVGSNTVRIITGALGGGLVSTLAGTNGAVTLSQFQSLSLIAPSATNWVQSDLQSLLIIP